MRERGGRGKKRQTETERDRQRQRETDTDRQTDRNRGRAVDLSKPVNAFLYFTKTQYSLPKIVAPLSFL